MCFFVVILFHNKNESAACNPYVTGSHEVPPAQS